MGLWETIVVAVVAAIMFISLYRSYYTPEVVVFIALIVIWNAGIITTDDAVSGFSNDGMLAVGVLFVVVKGIEKCQVVDRLARHVFGLKTSPRMGLFRLMCATFLLSAFLNNTPIVAALIPVTRDWARMRGFSPSLFLMPLSFSCILGGLLTIIGTSTNLVVNGIVADAGQTKISFFEPGYVSLPIGIISILFLTIASPYVLPKSGGLFRLVRDRADELITELQIEANCDLVGKPIAIVMARINLPLDTVIKIRRKVEEEVKEHLSLRGQPKDLYKKSKGALWGKEDNVGSPSSIELTTEPLKKSLPPQSFRDIYPVQPQERIEAEDILFLSCAQSVMIQFNAERITNPLKGLKILDVSALDLPGCGTQFFELVLGSGNKFDGALIGVMKQEFFQHYGANVIAVRRKGYDEDIEENAMPSCLGETSSKGNYSPLRSTRGNSGVQKVEVLNQKVTTGDLVLVLAKDEFAEKWKSNTGTLHSDFFLISSVGKVPDPIRKIDYIPIVVFILMLIWVVIVEVNMVRAAMAAAAFLIAFGFISAKEAVGYVDWALLLLIGSALGISRAIDESGLAQYVADFIADAGLSPILSLTLLLIFCVLMTELITNNAAAALCTPLALSISKELNVSHKPFVLAIMIAASASFCTPIGYQTNTMVWAPGGYKFGDFLKLGFLLTVVMCALTIALLPVIFPF